MATVRIKLTKSLIGRLPKQRKTVAALGLKKIGQSVEKEMTPSLNGMIEVIKHMVQVEEI
ncbi:MULTISPECIES: 50S ribosomal protein L30 [Anoxynatronum]|uniref:Large ribosomal subunit protein uL30 n=2 Tax=Anoxynatronum TaxID=210622 RepID=A0AA45WYM5_9CLOT|nr:50S ribosomal protein L30 [Anoxynatronum buryatiense]SMP69601.1 LSU ribosomal protein L30P [Anoxynatronum buryatiense]